MKLVYNIKDKPKFGQMIVFALQQVLDTLPPRDRALIRLRYLGHQTQQATADRLGMTQVQVSRRERAVLIELRQKLSV